MPCDYTKYPPNWKEISDGIRFGRAGGKCEKCGAAHGSHKITPKKKAGSARGWKPKPWFTTNSGTAASRAQSGDQVVQVFLGTAHLNHDTTDNRPENLKALCQECHNRYDAAYRQQNARRSRLQKLVDNGQTTLFQEDSHATSRRSHSD